MKKIFFLTIIATSLALLQSCSVIRPGEVAIKVKWGKIKPEILTSGTYGRGIFGTHVVRFDVRVKEFSDKINFHSKEGVEINSELSVLYHLNPDSVKNVYLKFDNYYENMVIVNNLITIIRQEGLNHSATSLITERTEFENAIKEKLLKVIGVYGFCVDLVMLKEVHLPENVIQTIQSRLNSEQFLKKNEIDLEIKRKNLDYEIENQKKLAELEITKQRFVLDFAVEKQKKETERLLIEAEGVRKSQDIINSSLTDKIIKLKALEISKGLMISPNTKIIITDGKSPLFLNDK
jgi:regulator of protease activity HflC (stomatin/prohibitin superfamily)